MSKIYFETGMGAAGDMIAAALADLMEDPERVLEEFNEAIQDSGFEEAVAELTRRYSNGIEGEDFSVDVDEESEDYHPEEHYHEHHRPEHFDDYHDHHRPEHFDTYHDHHDHGPHDRPHRQERHEHRHFDEHHSPGCRHHDHWDHPHFERPRGPHGERCGCGPHFRPPMMGMGGCPVEIHLHLHLGETIIKGKKHHKHHKHCHHHGHHRHHKPVEKMQATKSGKGKQKKAANKKTISLNHQHDHLHA